MRGYLSVKGQEAEITLEKRTEVYRDPDDETEIVAETKGRTVNLGVADLTVSRKTGGEPPIVIEPRSESIEIRNEGNTNGVTVSDGSTEIELDEGLQKRIQRDVLLEIGYQTVLRLEVEREAREEYVIQGDVETGGDVVMGDATHIDNSTTVEDSVVNRSDLGGSDSGATVDDSVVNRSSVGGEEPSPTQSQPDGGLDSESRSGDTRQFCDEHQVSYTDTCPKCNDESTGDTKYCMYCGESIPTVAVVCPECGKQL